MILLEVAVNLFTWTWFRIRSVTSARQACRKIDVLSLNRSQRQLACEGLYGHLCKVQALPPLGQLDQLRFLQLAVSWSRITVAHLSSMPGSADHCWTTPNLCTNGDVDPCEEFILQFAIWGPAPFVTLVQQPEVVRDTFCLHPLTNKRHLKYWLALKQISSDNMVQFVTDVVQRVGVFGKLIQCTMPV